MADDLTGRLNSATKYPSIPTYHELDSRTGNLLPVVDPAGFGSPYEGPIVLTEKVDGTSGRIVVMPGGDWYIGSREELIYARGDRIVNPALGIVPALLPLAPTLQSSGLTIRVYFLEVYGYRVGPAAKQYTRDAQAVGYRLFDAAQVPPRVTDLVRSEIAGWRDRGGQQFLGEDQLLAACEAHGRLQLAPRLGTVDSSALPVTLEEASGFLKDRLPVSRAVLDDTAGGRPEGIVLRTPDRRLIAKARFQDYERTLTFREGGRKRA
jgi:RNA ligase